MHRVILVEDEMLVRLGLRNAVNWQQFNMNLVADAANGAEAWQLYESLAPDLVITDIRMPVMDGMELIRRIREKDARTRIIILTCVEEFETVRQALGYGVSDYILKLTMTPVDIEKILAKIQQELDTLSQSKPNAPRLSKETIVENLFKDYLFRNYHTIQEFNAKLAENGIPLTESKLVLLLMEIDYFERLQHKYKDVKGNLISYSVHNVLKEVCDSYKRFVVIHDERNRFMLIGSFQDVSSEHRMLTELNEMTDHIAKIMKTIFNVSVTFGQSSIRSGFPELKAQYVESADALMKKYVLGTGRMIRQSDQQVQAEVENQLKAVTASGERLQNEVISKQIQQEVRKFTNCSTQNDKVSFLHLFARLMHLPLVVTPTEENVQQAAMKYFSRMERSESLAETCNVFDEYMAFLSESLQWNRQYSKEIVQARQYIHQRFKLNVSLSEVSSHVGMSPNYFSKQFRSETGEYLTDFINRLRIDEAKKVLLESNQRSYEIAASVGFADHSYFSRVFKKYTGVSPTEYRDLWYGHGTERAEGDQK
ncbi:response regulator [Cohnella soli]|uniref:Response regulator n=1 Tax=Cohnella soli TaxID=425005 RepID=A0ABW0I266_9BACL